VLEPVRRRPVRVTDVLLPAALALWLLGVHLTNPDAMDDWGLLRALPVVWFVGAGLLLVSIGFLISESRPSPLRLVLHLVALVLVLHGTVPMVFPETNFPWAYKHMGVVGYITRHGALDPSIDIYQNWPGFFAVAALFGRIAGVGSPLAYAKWAPVYFNLLLCLELAFILRCLAIDRRERWLALFLFVVGNWVGQDYFAPQALALVLSLAVYGMVLTWQQVRRPPDRRVRAGAWWTRRVVRARTDPPEDARASAPAHMTPELSGGARALAFGGILVVFAVVVVSHQLSPYLVVAGLGLLAVAGLIRPWWLVVLLAAVMIAYLVPRLPYLHRTNNLSGSPLNPRDVLAALGNPFDNLKSGGFGDGIPRPGRAMTSLGAPGLILGMWVLALIGVIRGVRAGRPVLLLLVVAVAPAFLAFGQNYGGEAIFRIYLFSLPWIAALAALALGPGSRRWSRTGGLTGTTVVVVLAGAAVLFMAAFYGSVELYRVRPGAVAAERYFYDHAPRDSVLGVGAPDVPARLSANYDEFLGGSTPPALSTVDGFRDHVLGPADLAPLSRLYQDDVARTPGSVYLFLSADQDVYAYVLGLMAKHSIAHLDQALAGSPEWRVFYRNPEAVIYQFVGLPAAEDSRSSSRAQPTPQECGGRECGPDSGGQSGQGIVQSEPGERGSSPGSGDARPAP